MTAQLELLLAPTARTSDPETSAAAVPSDAHLSALQASIMEAFRFGRVWTDDELCRISFPGHNPGTVIKRRSELVHAGRLVDTGARRPVRRSGRAAVVWGLA